MSRDKPGFHWQSFARAWSWIGPPLRPGEEDLAILISSIQSFFSGKQDGPRHRFLLLGVTPEIATMHLPSMTHLTAVDRDEGMIGEVWPGNTPDRVAVRADWLHMPFPNAMFDFVIGDGVLTPLGFPYNYQSLSEELYRCMKPGGLLALRVFCRPDAEETVADIFSRVQKKQIRSFDAFKWRLLMSIQGANTARGVSLGEAWDTWNANVPDPEAFALSSDWSTEKVRVIDHYRNSTIRYSFPSIAEVHTAFAPCFEQVSCVIGHYELAERCPHLLLRAIST